MQDRPQAYTVSAITRMIKSALEGQFQGIWVEGEISNYHHHSSGHRYITLKDDKAVIKVTMWKSMGAYLKFEPENGQKVLAFGDISVYEKGGQYQLTAKRLVPAGMGELELAFRQLYEKLHAEGLFDEALKKPLPSYPKKIGIVTSPTGAAIRDIIQIARRRNHTVQLIIYPAKVQGDGAEETIAAGIRYFNTRDDIDIVITGRGGGSLEDLWPFNTETTVRAIVASNIPVVSAVGHEVDITLSDLASDLRTPTPSAAAELAVWSLDDYMDLVQSLVRDATASLKYRVTRARQELDSTLDRPVYQRPLDLVNQRRQHLDVSHQLLSSAGKNSLERHKNRLSLRLSSLEALSPLKTLARGYSVSRGADNHALIKSLKDIDEGGKMETILPDGRLVSVVESKQEKL